MTDSTPRERIRSILDTLPDAEIETGGEHDQHLGASVRKKRFAWYLDDHHGDGAVAITCKAPAGVNVSMVESDPERYFIPSYTGHRGWFGIQMATQASAQPFKALGGNAIQPFPKRRWNGKRLGHSEMLFGDGCCGCCTPAPR